MFSAISHPSVEVIGALVAALLMFCGGTSHCAELVELDLDGQLGNGPDSQSAMVGDQVDVDVWYLGDNALLYWGLVLCNPDGALDFQGAVYYTPTIWVDFPPSFPFPGCVEFSASGGAHHWLSQPLLAATITYEVVADQTVGHLVVDTENSGYFDTFAISGSIDGATNASVIIGSTGTEETSWGAIKQLFR